MDRQHSVAGGEDEVDHSYYRHNRRCSVVGEVGVVQLDQWKPVLEAEAVATDLGMVLKVDTVVAVLEAVTKGEGVFCADNPEMAMKLKVEVVAAAAVGHPEVVALNEGLREEVASGGQGSPCCLWSWWVADEV